MTRVHTLGIDLGKSEFQLHGVAERGQTVLVRRVKRARLLGELARLGPCVVAMEACAGSHYWARQVMGLGQQVKLIAPQYVKPYVGTHKSDTRDAQGICEAARRPGMPTVAVKTIEQQDLQALERVRERWVGERTALGNHLRALLGEYGLVVGQGAGALARAVPELLEQADNGLSAVGRELVAELWAHWQLLHRQAQAAERRLARWAHGREDCRRLMSIPGIGPVNAAALVAYVGDARRFDNARALSASLGIVPRQHSSGAQRRLLGITKQGDKHLRALLIHGARAALVRMAGKSDRLSRWACALVQRRGFNRAVVALANKLARIAWALLVSGQRYQAQP